MLARYVYAGGMHIAKISGADTVWYHADALGSTRKMTKEDGTAYDWSATYYPFGEMTPTGNGANTHAFTGKEFDTEMGLNYFCLRYYDPQIGRFMTLDPFGGYVELPQSQNRYAYVMNNPLKYIDPLGLQQEPSDPPPSDLGTYYYDDNGQWKRLDDFPAIAYADLIKMLLALTRLRNNGEPGEPKQPIPATFEDLVYLHKIPGWRVDENGNVVRILPYQSLSERPATMPEAPSYRSVSRKSFAIGDQSQLQATLPWGGYAIGKQRIIGPQDITGEYTYIEENKGFGGFLNYGLIFGWGHGPWEGFAADLSIGFYIPQALGLGGTISYFTNSYWSGVYIGIGFGPLITFSGGVST